MDIVKELEKFCDYAIKVGYLDETDKSPLINIYMAHFYNSMSECERQPITNNKGNGNSDNDDYYDPLDDCDDPRTMGLNNGIK